MRLKSTMITPVWLPGALLCLFSLGSCLPSAAAQDAGATYDMVILNGRVMDPESGLDAVCNVGITGGTIRAISTEVLRGQTSIDASGLIVAPGFIDLHQHGQTPRTTATRPRTASRPPSSWRSAQATSTDGTPSVAARPSSTTASASDTSPCG